MFVVKRGENQEEDIACKQPGLHTSGKQNEALRRLQYHKVNRLGWVKTITISGGLIVGLM